MTFGFFSLGPTELILILLIVLVIFGPRKLPEVGRSLGEMLSNFRKGAKSSENGENGEAAANGDDTSNNNNKAV